MNKTKQYKRFIYNCTDCLESSQQWVGVSLEGFEGSLETSDKALLSTCILLLKKTSRVLLKLEDWLEENYQSEDHHKVVYLVGGIKKLTNSWASGNICK